MAIKTREGAAVSAKVKAKLINVGVLSSKN